MTFAEHLRRRSGPFRPVPWGAAELAARQQIVELVNAHVQLWPELNRLTLSYEHDGIRCGVDWCATPRVLEKSLNIRGCAADCGCRYGRRAETDNPKPNGVT